MHRGMYSRETSSTLSIYETSSGGDIFLRGYCPTIPR